MLRIPDAARHVKAEIQHSRGNQRDDHDQRQRITIAPLDRRRDRGQRRRSVRVLRLAIFKTRRCAAGATVPLGRTSYR